MWEDLSKLAYRIPLTTRRWAQKNFLILPRTIRQKVYSFSLHRTWVDMKAVAGLRLLQREKQEFSGIFTGSVRINQYMKPSSKRLNEEMERAKSLWHWMRSDFVPRASTTFHTSPFSYASRGWVSCQNHPLNSHLYQIIIVTICQILTIV